MELKTLRTDWQKVHPTGNVWISCSNGELLDDGKQTGKFAVTFTSDGKIYTYQMKSVYALAERLGMIPTERPDVRTDATNAIKALQSGDTYSSICGLSDEIHHQLGGNWWVVVGDETKDEYHRTVYHYTALIEKSY
jgi:hypothetical protein